MAQCDSTENLRKRQTDSKGTVPQVTCALFHHCSFSLAMPSIWSLQWSFPELNHAGPRLGLCPQELALNYSILVFVLFIPKGLASNK